MAVLGSLVSSVLMFFLGLYDIYLAFMQGISLATEATQGSPNALAVIKVIEGLDRFLIAIVLLYFAYGVYSLFIRPDEGTREKRDELALPSWLKVKEVGQLKQVVAEVIMVIIFVLFLRVAMQAFQRSDLVLSLEQIGSLLVLPLCATLLALALKLVELHPKKTWRPKK